MVGTKLAAARAAQEGPAVMTPRDPARALREGARVLETKAVAPQALGVRVQAKTLDPAQALRAVLAWAAPGPAIPDRPETLAQAAVSTSLLAHRTELSERQALARLARARVARSKDPRARVTLNQVRALHRADRTVVYVA